MYNGRRLTSAFMFTDNFGTLRQKISVWFLHIKLQYIQKINLSKKFKFFSPKCLKIIKKPLVFLADWRQQQ